MDAFRDSSSESVENKLTYSELLDILKREEVKFINSSFEDIKENILYMREFNLKHGNKDIFDSPVDEENGMYYINEYGIFLEKEKVVIGEYEMSNPFIFGDVVVVPGRDSITCYNLKTGEHVVSYIR